MVTVKAEAGGEMKMVAVEITVENVDELGTLAGDTNVTYAEGRTDAVGNYEVTGGDGSAINWSLEGADAGQFTLEGTGMSRTLMFSSALDFEAPADADGDNEYMVTVKAEAGGEEETVGITINGHRRGRTRYAGRRRKLDLRRGPHGRRGKLRGHGRRWLRDRLEPGKALTPANSRSRARARA